MKYNRTFFLGILLSVGLCQVGCSGAVEGEGAAPSTAQAAATTVTTAESAPAPAPVPPLGAPVAGIDAVSLALFEDGKNDFATPDVAPELGPIFNGPVFNADATASVTELLASVSLKRLTPNTMACATCHIGGVAQPEGGSNGGVEIRFGKTTSGTFDPLTAEGGSLLQFFAVAGATPETLPADANTVALRRTTGLFGAGLIDAIPDDAIRENAASQQASFPEQAGELVIDVDPDVNEPHVGRFGWKCQHATLYSFAGDAYLNEMGVSNPLFPEELVANGAAVPVALAAVKDQPGNLTVAVPGRAGLQLTDIQRFTNFMRFLGPPPVANSTPELAQGSMLFTSVGCEVCHTRSFPTVSNVAALDRKTVNVFSDFLLHDVGTGDGIVQAASGGQETANKLRTAPLMAVRGKPLMHDSASLTVASAISRHGNQGATSVRNFDALSPAEQQLLLDYVESL